MSNSNKVILPTECYGCRACEQACPTNCIEMLDDGFLHPIIDYDKCISCGKCTRNCQMLNKKPEFELDKQRVYAAWSKDEEDVNVSTSGSIFTVLAKQVIEEKGIVFGAIYEDNKNVVTGCADNLETMMLMQGSKYVFCDTGKSYSEAKKALEDNRKVLYTGTPCQIAGLRMYLGKDYDNLLCVDLICHGVPSKALFRKYIDMLEKDYKSGVSQFRFRYKKEGEKAPYYRIDFEDGTAIEEKLKDNKYSKVYNSMLAHMKQCHHCNYKVGYRASDIIIGDFWGIDTINPEHYNEKGTSLIIVNSPKGEKWLDGAREHMHIFEEKMENAVLHNPALTVNVPRHKFREAFLECLDKKGFDSAYKKYFIYGKVPMLLYRVARKFKKLLRRGKHD